MVVFVMVLAGVVWVAGIVIGCKVYAPYAPKK